MPLKVLLTTTVTWPFAARLAASFASLGARVEALMPRGHALAHSRHLSASHVYRPIAAQLSLRAAVAASAPDLIVPCDDRAIAQLLTAHRHGGKRLRALIARSLGRPGSYPLLSQRAALIAEAEELGLAVPKTARAYSLREFMAFLPAFGFPLVVKRDGTWGGDGVAIARTQGEAEAAWARFSRKPSV